MNKTMNKNDELARDLLTTALEGGSNYWYGTIDYRLPEGTTLDDFREGGRLTDPNEYWHPAEIIPFHEGGALLILGDEDAAREMPEGGAVIDRAKMRATINLMREKYPRMWGEAMEGEHDANHGDVFLQLAALGSVVFG